MNLDLSILKKAREIITPEDCWTKGNEARDKDGEGTDFDLDEAICFSAEGAIKRSVMLHPDYFPGTPREQYIEAVKVERRVVRLMVEEIIKSPFLLTPIPPIMSDIINTWNDNPDVTHRDVLDMFDKGISVFSGQEA